MSASPGSFWRRYSRWLPGLLISLVAVIVLINLVSWQDLKAAFLSVSLVSLLIAILLTFLSLILRAQAWRIMLGSTRPSLFHTFLIINEGYLLNNLFPLKAGEFGRAIIMGQNTRLGTFHVLSTIIIERALDIGIAAGMLLATLPFAIGAEWAKSVAVITLIFVTAGFGILFFISANTQKVKNWMEKVTQKNAWISRWVAPRLNSLLDGFQILNSPLKFLAVLGLIALSWLMWLLLYYVMLVPMVPGTLLWQAAFVESILALGVAVPSAPAALGVYEAAMVGGLAILRVAESVALGYAIAMHFLQFAFTGIFGVWGITRDGLSLGSLFNRVQSSQKSEPAKEEME